MKEIAHKNWKLAYEKTGDKLPPLLLFHGFGQSHIIFNALIAILKKKYTCYSFDLFYHGKSSAPHGGLLRPLLWNEIIERFMLKENINKCSLLGFSMGGKFVLEIMMHNPEKVNELYFIAPDGIKTNIWYSLATYPYLLRMLFKSLVKYPAPLFVIARLAASVGFLNKSLLKFVQLQMNSRIQREQVYNTWVGFRHLKYKSSEISAAIRKNNIPTTIFLGEYDNVIPLKPFLNFAKKTPPVKLLVLKCGHNSLIRKVTEYFDKLK